MKQRGEGPLKEKKLKTSFAREAEELLLTPKKERLCQK